MNDWRREVTMATDLAAEHDLTLIFERDDVHDAFEAHCTHVGEENVRTCADCQQLRLVLANAIVEWLGIVDQDRAAREVR